MMGSKKKIKGLKAQGELYKCPSCDYQDGFHVSFKWGEKSSVGEIFLICPNCQSRFRLPFVDGGGAHTVVLREDGTVWTYGENGSGQLGDGTNVKRNNPIRLAALSDIVSVVAGPGHTLAVRADGTEWAWGWNGYSQLGDGTTTNSLTPVQVKDPSDPSGFLTGVVRVAAAERYSIALKSNGTVWTWGTHDYAVIGRLYSGTGSTPQEVAGQVAGLTNVIAIAAGWEHTLALKGDGTVWACGRNLEGQLGDGTTTGSFFPPPSPPKFFVQVKDTGDPTGYLTGGDWCGRPVFVGNEGEWDGVGMGSKQRGSALRWDHDQQDSPGADQRSLRWERGYDGGEGSGGRRLSQSFAQERRFCPGDVVRISRVNLATGPMTAPNWPQ